MAVLIASLLIRYKSPFLLTGVVFFFMYTIQLYIVRTFIPQDHNWYLCCALFDLLTLAAMIACGDRLAVFIGLFSGFSSAINIITWAITASIGSDHIWFIHDVSVCLNEYLQAVLILIAPNFNEVYRSLCKKEPPPWLHQRLSLYP